jgi:preprotein translocase subunit SecA
VDEADSVLIDEAVMPFIISAPRENAILVDAVQTTAHMVAALERGRDYHVDKLHREVRLLPEGLVRIQALSETGGAQSLPGIWQGIERRQELLEQALYVRELLQRDRHYVVLDGKVVLVDEMTGRLTPNRQLGIGLHQALEAAEGVKITSPAETLARFSYQKFFRLFPHLSGMSGTIRESAPELWRLFGLAVLTIPTHRPIQRRSLSPVVFRNNRDKWQSLVGRIVQIHASGQPVLVGTRSIAASEQCAAMLKIQGLPYALLNAVRHQQEAEIVANAGKQGRITIATNMAGRGTDIKLGPGVANLGGLYVIAAEPNESLRVDRQLFGRSGRQGNPGYSQLYYSLDDPLVQRFLPRVVRGLLSLGLWYRLPGMEALSHLVLHMVRWRMGYLAMKQRNATLHMDQWLENHVSFS